jgi:L-aminopeptidase/D-esterase-like protein
LVPEVHAVLLAGGSAFGLDATGGVMRYLEEQGYGLDMEVAKVPIVPTAVLFDLPIGNPKARPGVEEGYRACLAAMGGEVEEGTVGAGTGARVGKALGAEQATKSGIGTASQGLGEGIIVGAIVAVNAFGDVVNPNTGDIIAAPRRLDGKGFSDSSALLKSGKGLKPSSLGNTTLGVVATNAKLTKAEAAKIAQMAQDGISRTIRPAHTILDGDVIFVLGKKEGKEVDVSVLGLVAAEVIAEAAVRAITQAKTLCGIPAASDLV